MINSGGNISINYNNQNIYTYGSGAYSGKLIVKADSTSDVALTCINRNTSGSTGGNESVSIAFVNEFVANQYNWLGKITLAPTDSWTGTASTRSAAMIFSTNNGGTQGERLRISPSGEVCVGGTTRNNGYNDNFRTLVVESTATDTASILELVGTRGVGGNQNGMIHFINKNASAVETARIAGINGASSVNEGNLQFMTRTAATGLAEKMRLTGDGYLRLASGTGGIQFGGDTAVANALDDYEEGTFTPVIGDGTYTFTNLRGHYFKIGRMVHIHIGLRINAATPGTATTSISGLPYASEATGSYQEPHTRCGVAGNCVTANLANNLGYFIVNGTAVLNGRSSASNADTPVKSNDLWQANTFIKFQMIYSTS